jgi:hypothetical protein
MSHVAQIKLVIDSLDVLQKAVERIGGTLERDHHKLKMYGSGFVDDSSDWRSMFAPAESNRIASLPKKERVKIINKKMSRPDHTLAFIGASYNVGVFQNPDEKTFSLRWDYYSQGGLVKFMGDRSGGKLTQAYGLEKAKRMARLRGYATKEVAGENGQIKLEMLVR